MSNKNILSTLLCTLLSLGLYAQSGGFFFQGYAIDHNGKVIENATITAKFTIYDKDTPAVNYQEEQTFSTNEFGVFGATVGGGISFNRLSFSAGDFWMKVEVRKGTGTEPFTTICDAQLATVPYAKSADNANPVGTITPFAGSVVPDGWLLCDGSAINRATYKGLFDVIGTTYGSGNDISTFNLPDLRSQTTAGLDTDDSDFVAIGKTGGAVNHTLTLAQLSRHTHERGNLSIDNSKSHTHPYNDYTSHGMVYYWGGWFSISGADVQQNTERSTLTSGSHSHTISGNTSSTGGSHAFNILQPYLTVNYIIRVR